MAETGHLPPSQILDPFSSGIASGTQNIFQAYMGPPKAPQETNALEKRNVTIWNMPEAYEGRNLFIKDTIEDWLWTADQTYYTEVILPWRVVNDIHVEWATWEANAMLMGQTPHQAASREISQRRTIRRASLVRWGLSLSFEHDFVKTALGRTSYLIGLGQIARSVQETANAEVIRALLHAHTFQQQYIRDNGLVRKREHIEWLTEDRDLFATCQKDPNGLVNWHATNKEYMHEYKGKADTLLLPAKMMQYVTMVRPENWQFWLKGPRGPGAIDDKNEYGATAREVTPVKLQDHLEPQAILGDLNVYQARAFHVDGVQPLDLLSRVRQIGEYNTMFDAHCDYATGYSSKERGVMIYNEDQDKMEIISLYQALENCGLFEEDGSLKPLQGMDRESAERDSRDARQDFLTLSGTRESVKIFGDIDPVHFGRSMLDDLGMTVVDSIFKGDPDRRNRLRQGLTNAREAFENNTAVTFETTGVDNFDTDFKYLVTRLRTYFGVDNYWLAGGDAVNNLFNSFVGFGVAPTTEASIGASADPTDPQSKRVISSTFKAIRMATVTEQDRAQFDAIANDNTRPVAQRLDNLRELVMSWVGRSENPLSQRLNSPQAVKNWYGEIRSMYDDAMQRTGGGTPSSGLGWAAPMRPDVEYAYPEIVGQLPPMGFTSFPRSLSEIPMFTQAKISAALSQRNQSGQRMGGQYDDGMEDIYGGGAYGIGQAQQFEHHVDAGDGDAYVPMPEGIAIAAGFATALEDRFRILQENLKIIAEGPSDGLTQICAAVFLGAAVRRQSFEAIIKHNILFPMNFLLARPHATYRGRIAIKVQAYGGAGRTYYGHSDAQVANDVNIKVGKVHFTCYMAAIVDAPQNVFVQPDLYIDRYLGGLGTKFWTPESYNSMQAEDNEESIICIALPYTERDIPNPMDIAGRFYTDYEYDLADAQQYEPLHYSTAYRYNNTMFNFFNRVNAMDEFDMPSLDPEQAHINRICWRGHQQFLNKRTGAYDLIDTNTGHWGPDVAPGRRRVSDGKSVYLRPQNYSSNGMSVAVL